MHLSVSLSTFHYLFNEMLKIIHGLNLGISKETCLGWEDIYTFQVTTWHGQPYKSSVLQYVHLRFLGENHNDFTVWKPVEWISAFGLHLELNSQSAAVVASLTLLTRRGISKGKVIYITSIFVITISMGQALTWRTWNFKFSYLILIIIEHLYTWITSIFQTASTHFHQYYLVFSIIMWFVWLLFKASILLMLKQNLL